MSTLLFFLRSVAIVCMQDAEMNGDNERMLCRHPYIIDFHGVCGCDEPGYFPAIVLEWTPFTLRQWLQASATESRYFSSLCVWVLFVPSAPRTMICKPSRARDRTQPDFSATPTSGAISGSSAALLASTRSRTRQLECKKHLHARR